MQRDLLTMQTGCATTRNTETNMIWETLIVCITVIILARGYIDQKTRELEIRNDMLDDEHLVGRHNEKGI